jgi:hypothetical protein
VTGQKIPIYFYDQVIWIHTFFIGHIHICLLGDWHRQRLFIRFDSRPILNMHHFKMYIRVHKLFVAEHKSNSTRINEDELGSRTSISTSLLRPLAKYCRPNTHLITPQRNRTLKIRTHPHTQLEIIRFLLRHPQGLNDSLPRLN